MIYYLPLESYQERYTYQLTGWTMHRFKERKIDYVVVRGDKLPTAEHIRKSVALDPHGRSYFGLKQMTKMVELLDSGIITSNDVIYMQDMFQPGYEVLPYIISQSEAKPKIATHCLAQSIDPNDFTFPMREWMRYYELMVDKTIDVIFVASSCMVDMLRASLFSSRTEVVGLPFDKDQVRSMVKAIPDWHNRKKQVVFSSRWDIEKQPEFYIEFAKAIKTIAPEYKCLVLTGQPELRSNSDYLLDLAKKSHNLGIIEIRENLTKQEYYEILVNSQVHFNCALQDFVSNTLNESSALGTISLLPSYLSFPEAVNNESRQLYVAWSLTDAINKFSAIIKNPPLDVVSYSADYQHLTLDRVIDVLETL